MIMCIGFSSCVHGSTADKGPIFTFCGSKSTVHQSCKTFDGDFVFAATLFTVRLLCGTEKLGLPAIYSSRMTSILEDVC